MYSEKEKNNNNKKKKQPNKNPHLLAAKQTYKRTHIDR